MSSREKGHRLKALYDECQEVRAVSCAEEMPQRVVPLMTSRGSLTAIKVEPRISRL